MRRCGTARVRAGERRSRSSRARRPGRRAGDRPAYEMKQARAMACRYAADHKVTFGKAYLQGAMFDLVNRDWVFDWMTPNAKGGSLSSRCTRSVGSRSTTVNELPAASQPPRRGASPPTSWPACGSGRARRASRSASSSRRPRSPARAKPCPPACPASRRRGRRCPRPRPRSRRRTPARAPSAISRTVASLTAPCRAGPGSGRTCRAASAVGSSRPRRR